MVADPLDRPILSHIRGQFIVLDEDINVANAVRDMHSRRGDNHCDKRCQTGWSGN